MKTEIEIEKMLQSNQTQKLTDNERSFVKAQVMDFARGYRPAQKQAVISPFSYLLWRGSAVFAVLLLAFVGTAYASTNSVPGDPLYSMKVYVVEDMIEFTKFSPLQKANYDVVLLENRLDELKTLSPEASANPRVVKMVADQISEHVDNIHNALDAEETELLTYQIKLALLNKASALIKAQSSIAESTESLNDITKCTETATDKNNATVNQVLTDFTASRPTEELTEYLGDQIETFSLVATATSTTDLEREQIIEYLNQTNESLIEGDMVDAMMSTLGLQQEFDVADLLEGTSTVQ